MKCFKWLSCVWQEGSAFWMCFHGQGLPPTLTPTKEECSRSSLVKYGTLNRVHFISMGLRWLEGQAQVQTSFCDLFCTLSLFSLAISWNPMVCTPPPSTFSSSPAYLASALASSPDTPTLSLFKFCSVSNEKHCLRGQRESSPFQTADFKVRNQLQDADRSPSCAVPQAMISQSGFPDMNGHVGFPRSIWRETASVLDKSGNNKIQMFKNIDLAKIYSSPPQHNCLLPILRLRERVP